MNDLTTTVIKAIENLTKDRANGGFEEVLSHVVKGLAVCGFFQCENWKSIVESTFDPCICAENTSNTEQALLANDELNVSQVFNDLADILQADSYWNQLFPNFFTENLESCLTYNDIEMELCRSEGNLVASSTNATDELHTPRKSSTASNEICPTATMHTSDPQIAAPVNGTTPPQHIPICTGEMCLTSPVDNRRFSDTSSLNRQYEKPSTHSENNVETTASIETSNVEFWKELPSEIVNQQLLMDVDVDVEPQNTNLMPPIRRISSAEELLAELLSLSSDDETLTSFTDETNRIYGQHDSDISAKTTSVSDKHEQNYPCGYQNFDLQLVTKQVEHTGETVVSLPLCNQALSQPAALKNMQQLRQRLKIHRNEKYSQKSYVCDVCQKEFQSRSILAIHKRTHTGQKPHVCDVCQKAFARSSHLTVHNRTHTGEKPFVCDVCQRAFAHAKTLSNHKMIHNGQKPHTCDVCQKSFARSSCLVEHKMIHTGQKPHACDVCQKSFARPSHLADHKMIHTGQKPHVCDVCQKAFAQSSTLLSHKRTHNGEKPFVCDVCQRAFAHAATLSMHKLIHTGQKPHECDVCQKAFAHPSNLLSHKRTHNGEKPFVCDVCQRAFAHAATLSMHKLIHTGQKPHVCEVCQKPFRQLSALSRHKRIQHGEHFSCAHCGQSFSQKADIEFHLVQCFKEHNRRRKG